jgi:hypothetical protein
MDLEISPTGNASQQTLELEFVRLAVRRTYASAFNSTKIVDGLPKRPAANRVPPLKDVA